MAHFKISDLHLKQLSNIVEQIKGKYAVPIVDILRSLKPLEDAVQDGVEKVIDKAKDL